MSTVPVIVKPKKIKNVRAQLFSMRNIVPSEPAYISARGGHDAFYSTLEKSLEKHNQIDDPETSEPEL